MIFIVDKHLHSTFNLYGIFNSRLHSRNDYIAFLLILKILDCVAWLLAPYFFEILNFSLLILILPSTQTLQARSTWPSVLQHNLQPRRRQGSLFFRNNAMALSACFRGRAGGRGIFAFDKLSFLNHFS